MPKDSSIKKVLVIGSGPIVIGQAAEFDYAGTQACRSLKEEGVSVVLVNSNPATIMTDKRIADHVYIEPLTAEVLEQIIEKERPDSVLPTLGGQAGLNLFHCILKFLTILCLSDRLWCSTNQTASIFFKNTFLCKLHTKI